MAGAVAAEVWFRCVFEGCITTSDTDIERRPYHKNCSCALHRSSKTTSSNCSSKTKTNKKLSYPMRRSWSEGCLALSNINNTSSTNNSNSSSSSCKSLVANAIPPTGLSFGKGKPPRLFKINLWGSPTTTGIKAGKTVELVLNLAGFKNIKSKVVGSRNPHNTVKALFKALNAIETPKDVQEKFGRAVVESHLL